MTRAMARGLFTVWIGVASGMTPGVTTAQAIKVHGVKQLDTGMQTCDQESAFEVHAREGVRPPLRIKVTLKPAPDSITAQEIELRIELLDDRGSVVSLLDSTQVEASTNPPWRRVQIASDGRHPLDFENRLPPQDRIGMPRYRLRVSLDTAKAGAETRPFLLYWPDLGEQLCKRIR